jgi:hypothetical protein
VAGWSSSLWGSSVASCVGIVFRMPRAIEFTQGRDGLSPIPRPTRQLVAATVGVGACLTNVR